MPDDLVLRGSIVTIRGRCGKPRCRCVDGKLHERTALSVSLQNKTTLVSLRTDAEVAEVAAALERYRVAAAELETEVGDSLVELRRRLAAARSSTKGRA
jgi:hypothetical protein